MDKNYMTEETLDKELENLINDLPEKDDFEQNIDRYIKKKIRKITVRTVLAVLVILSILFLMISPVMNASFLNPVKLEEKSDRAFLKTLRSYYETTMPYVELCDVEVKQKGFAGYDIGLVVSYHKDVLRWGTVNAQVDVNQGKYENWQDPNMMMVHGPRFDSSESEEYVKELMKELEELPKSAEVYLSIRENTVRNVEELRKEAVELEWIEVYQPNLKNEEAPFPMCGLSMKMNAALCDTDRREKLSVKQLKEVYLSNLEILMEYPEVWTPLGINWRNYFFPVEDASYIEYIYKDAKKLKTFQTEGYCISGKRDEIIAYLQKADIASVKVDGVRSSQWENQ